jgi:hypothetical protein
MQPGSEMSPSVAECIDAAARFLSAQPGAVRRTLATHRRRPDGYCSSCLPVARWPCTMASVARAAAGHSPGPERGDFR